MIADLQRFGVTVFSAAGTVVPPRAIVPVFHRWIQSGAIAAHTLIDVADYEHVPGGPGVVLIAHEGLFSLGRADDRMVFTYTRRTPSAGSLADRLRLGARHVLLACQLIEGEADLGAPIRFCGDELEIFTNDRLRAPHTPAAYAALQSSLDDFLRALYGDHELTITPQAEPGERLGVHVRTTVAVSIRALLERA